MGIRSALSSLRKVAIAIGVLLGVAACVALVLIAVHGNPASWQKPNGGQSGEQQAVQGAGSAVEHVDTTGLERFSLDDVPAYSGKPYADLNDRVPYFDVGNASSESDETYSPLDALGRCSTAVALVSEDIMPTEPRGSISNVHPSGWQTTRYSWIDGEMLFNRCHLIAFQLSGENDNERNLITGTRYMNATGMLPFENEVAAYVHQTKNHVYYRVTPVFEGDNLVASGVIMEAESFEDAGAGVRFCVWCYNVEPGVQIDYATGESRVDGAGDDETAVQGVQQDYVLNTNTMRFHYPDCPSAADISSANRREVTAPREALIGQGYRPCGTCNP